MFYVRKINRVNLDDLNEKWIKVYEKLKFDVTGKLCVDGNGDCMIFSYTVIDNSITF